MDKKYLIVEGYYDFLFYTSLFNKLKIKDIKIISPPNFGFPYNGYLKKATDPFSLSI